MSSLAKPKEQRSAYQRWELDSFDSPGNGHKAAAVPAAPQLERLQQQARQEGYAAGHREGADRAAAEALRLRQIVAALTEKSQQFDQHVADELLGLALAISRQVLRQTLKLRPELILAVVSEVLGQLPLSHQRARLILHPEDATLVRLSVAEHLQQAGWEIVENAEISRGGCRLDAAECDIDATMECRWQRVVDAIGNGHGWIE